MSKKTRKKSVPGKAGMVARATSKKPPGKSATTTARATAAKSSGKPAKTPAKTLARRTTAKSAGIGKSAIRKAAVSKSNQLPPRSSVKTARKVAAAPKATSSSKPVSARAKNSAISAAPSETIAAPAHKAAAIEGAMAPAFDLPRDGGERVGLTDYSGRKLVIFFYPRANTPGCTKEAMDFTRLKGDFAAAGTDVLGVSADPVKLQESFRNKHQLTVPLGSDETHSMLEAYGAWGEKSMYGKTFEGVLRTTVLIDASGNVARIWRGVRVDGHAEDVLTVARDH